MAIHNFIGRCPPARNRVALSPAPVREGRKQETENSNLGRNRSHLIQGRERELEVLGNVNAQFLTPMNLGGVGGGNVARGNRPQIYVNIIEAKATQLKL